MVLDDWTPPSSAIGRSLKGIIFDLDGTLLSTLPLIIHCFNEVYSRYLDKTLSPEKIIASFGPTARDLIRIQGSNLSKDQLQRAVDDYYECYRENASSKVLIFPGIPELLEKLHRSGRRLAVVTGVERVLMEYTLTKFGLSGMFEAMVGGDDVRNSKPDPEGVKLALERMGLASGEFIFSGDSPADILAGKAAKVLTAAALWSPEGKADPTEAGPDYKFRSVQELSTFLMPSEKKEEPGFYFAKDLG
ncbi:MAG: hypothetical protein AUJ07_05775 [Crenarchaeota archaeon 13_1_40CM_3_53_5]|nr:MAG: hypothetical protein AUJ07_05775 [Crenarchaeota archaeon 13_1_40CM_3_53_5]